MKRQQVFYLKNPQTSLCNDLIYLEVAMGLLPLIGVQEYLTGLDITTNAALFLSDVLALLAIIRQVWSLWREKRRIQLQISADFVTLLLQQGASFVGVLRFLLTAILICEFTLELRRRNTERSIPNQSALELPNLSFRDNPMQSIQSVLGRVHENIISEMGERNDLVVIDGRDQEAA
ncbi:hypothetical protein Clacol_004318 [Clathrus columnatus]|uniref:Uncharacterized protein n=1 Tax=Clathrus columnatus TaxID=1419009 RepID=A0AAV5A969_9AGAM|nr:hypothetical protein Clacol_004318 [Clathrus columnatus]